LKNKVCANCIYNAGWFCKFKEGYKPDSDDNCEVKEHARIILAWYGEND